MKIGLDYQRVWLSYGGGSTSFAVGLLQGFMKEARENQIVLFVSQHNYDFFKKMCTNSRVEIVLTPEPNFILYRVRNFINLWLFRFQLKNIYIILTNWYWRKATRIKNSKCDILYSPTDLTGYKNSVRTAVSLHDIQQAHFPEFFSRSQLNERSVTFKACVENANYFQASSEFMRSDFLKHFQGMKKEQVFVIPEGVDIDLFSRAPKISEINERVLPSHFLYYPGQLWPHKNHSTVLKSLKILRDKGVVIPLVMTGARYSASEEIFNLITDLSLEDQVIYLGLVSMDDVRSLYKSAKAMITATLYESSSLPIRESAAAGTPIFASATPPNIEAAEILKINLFEPQSHTQLADILVDLWVNEQVLRKQAEFNESAVKIFSWSNVARDYIKFFELVCG